MEPACYVKYVERPADAREVGVKRKPHLTECTKALPLARRKASLSQRFAQAFYEVKKVV